MNSNNKRILVAYFSRRGQNYSNGRLMDLKRGNTEIAAEIIAEHTGADLFEICAAKEYPSEYTSCIREAQSELRANSRPSLRQNIEISDYDVIYLGFPNWWGTMPMPVWTFLESHDFSGKTLLPLCTHEGSGMGRSEADLQKLAKGADLRKGLAVHGSDVAQAKQSILEWAERS